MFERGWYGTSKHISPQFSGQSSTERVAGTLLNSGEAAVTGVLAQTQCQSIHIGESSVPMQKALNSTDPNNSKLGIRVSSPNSEKLIRENSQTDLVRGLPPVKVNQNLQSQMVINDMRMVNLAKAPSNYPQCSSNLNSTLSADQVTVHSATRNSAVLSNSEADSVQSIDTPTGKFTNAMPKMEVIRKEFLLQTELKDSVKLTHFNSRHLYLDLDNEYDHTTVWTKGKMYVEGQLMRFQLWTPPFKPDEETHLGPIWP
ncbi:hypothetical protein FXO37_34022 [Capsicum annuum]|nr:hypothetical protein FXO37_34022 [Capsicum annuum]